MPDSGSAVESPLDRLRRLAKESKTAKNEADAPPTTAPGVAAPLLEEPPAVEAAYDEPVYDEPVSDEPVYDEPVSDEPVYDESVFGGTSFDEPGSGGPGFDEPSFEEPVVPPPTLERPHEPAAATEVAAPEAAPSVEPTATAEFIAADVAGPEIQAAQIEDDVPQERPGPPAPARLRATGTQVAAPEAAAPIAADQADPTIPLQRGPGSSRLIAATATLGLLVVLAIVGLILAVRHENTATRPVNDRAAATAAAGKMVADVTTFDYRKADDWLRRVQADSTDQGSDASTASGGLRSDFANQKDALLQSTTAGKSVAVGTVVKSVFCGGACATSQVAGATASALVYVATTVTGTSTPAGRTTKNRFTVKLIKINGTWLADNLDYDPAQASS